MTRRETKAKVKKGDSKFVEKSPGNFPSRYKGELSPKAKIVEEPVNPSFKSRYK